jgi:hypothetical protein
VDGVSKAKPDKVLSLYTLGDFYEYPHEYTFLPDDFSDTPTQAAAFASGSPIEIAANGDGPNDGNHVSRQAGS